MTVHDAVQEINGALNETFRAVDAWFDKPADLRAYRPARGGWTIDEVLEHIALTSHFLLILIDKGARKAKEAAARTGAPGALAPYDFHRAGLTEVGLHQSFEWMRPEHMEPKGEKSSAEVRAQLTQQLQQCRATLANLKEGEGTLYKTTMSVNNLGKIDVYEYIFFLAQHARRHITQMERAEGEWNAAAR